MQKLLKMVKTYSEIAENGEEAVSKYLNQSYDVILMDIQMPVLNGYEAAKKIREHEKISKKRVPIIALTAYAMQSDREKCLEAGMDDYLSKPFNNSQMQSMLERWLPRTKAPQQNPVDAPEKRPSVIRAMLFPSSLSLLIASEV